MTEERYTLDIQARTFARWKAFIPLHGVEDRMGHDEVLDSDGIFTFSWRGYGVWQMA